jgi:hypothetical protein
MKPAVLVSVLLSVFAVGYLLGRSSNPPVSPTVAAAASSVAAPAPSLPQTPPFAAEAAPERGAPTFLTGAVAEVIQVPNYTYLRLSTSGGDAWAAVATNTSIVTGQPVTVAAQTEMSNFTSKSLGRTFPSIWFGELSSGAVAQVPAPPGLPSGHPPTGAKSATDQAVAALNKAEGALDLRVANVFSERALLAGRTVRVKGTVAKVTSVNGTTYAHLTDGSGSADSKDNDLVVILSAEVKAQDQVTVEGTVSADKDLGIGVIYPVVLDGAKVTNR